MGQLLQPIEFLDPMLQRETAQRRHFDRSIDPIVCLARPEVEIPVGSRQANIVALPLQLVVDCLEE